MLNVAMAKGLFFNGEGFVDLSSIGHVTGDGDDDFSIDLWFNPDVVTGNINHPDNFPIFSSQIINSNIGNGRFIVSIIGGFLKVQIITTGFSGNFPATNIPVSAVTFNQWYHLVVMFQFNSSNTTQMHVYLDGNLVHQDLTASGFSIDDFMNPVYLGCNGIDANYFIGGIDEVRVWNRLLAPPEIQILANHNPAEAVGPLPATPGFFARFTMDMQSDPLPILSSIGPHTGDLLGTTKPYRLPQDDVSLPIELSSFIANAKSGVVNLDWTTESEVNNAGFNVLRSENDLDYEKINVSLIEGAINSSTANSYTFTDTEVKANTKYYYKLEDVSTSGETNLNGPVTVTTGSDEVSPAKFTLGTAYPNPFNPSTTINFALAEEAKVQINIYDMKGNLVNTLTNNDYATGNYNVVWNAVDFNGNPVSAGIYIYQMTTNTGFSQSAKMILIK